MLCFTDFSHLSELRVLRLRTARGAAADCRQRTVQERSVGTLVDDFPTRGYWTGSSDQIGLDENAGATASEAKGEKTREGVRYK